MMRNKRVVTSLSLSTFADEDNTPSVPSVSVDSDPCDPWLAMSPSTFDMYAEWFEDYYAGLVDFPPVIR